MMTEEQLKMIEALDLVDDAFDEISEEADRLLAHIYRIREQMAAKYGAEEADRRIDDVFERLCEDCVDDEMMEDLIAAHGPPGYVDLLKESGLEDEK